MENKWYMYRNKKGQEVKKEGTVSEEVQADLFYNGYELLRVIDLTVTVKEKKAK